MKSTVVVTLVGVVVVLAIVGFGARRAVAPTVTAPADEAGTPPVVPATESPQALLTRPPGSPAATFGTPKKSAHFESSTPAHGTTLAAPPINVVVDVNFDLAQNSAISVTSGGKEFGTGPTTIDTNKLAMRRAVDPSAPDGLYRVTYKACWPDGSCHDGLFEFAVDRTLKTSARDLRGQSSVTVRLADIAFAPAALRISKGTTVTWINDDAVEHYINTDAHPSHTYYLDQNSKVLKTGETYALAFQTPGAYPYHCSAHAAAMTGMILVE